LFSPLSFSGSITVEEEVVSEVRGMDSLTDVVITVTNSEGLPLAGVDAVIA